MFGFRDTHAGRRFHTIEFTLRSLCTIKFGTFSQIIAVPSCCYCFFGCSSSNNKMQRRRRKKQENLLKFFGNICILTVRILIYNRIEHLFHDLFMDLFVHFFNPYFFQLTRACVYNTVAEDWSNTFQKREREREKEKQNRQINAFIFLTFL